MNYPNDVRLRLGDGDRSGRESSHVEDGGCSDGLTTRLVRLDPRAATCRGRQICMLYYSYSQKKKKRKNRLITFK